MAKQKKTLGGRPLRAKASASKARRQSGSRTTADEKVAQFRRQLKEARNQLKASTEVLQLISSTSGSLDPVFDAVLQRALKLCEAAFGFITIYDGKRFDPVAQHGVPDALADYFAEGMDQPRPGEAHARLLAGEDLVHNLDQKNEDVYRNGSPLRRAIVDLGGVRSALVVALRKDGVLLGALTIYRKEVRAFTQRQIGMLQNFAAQAAIAIANARLFENVQAKTRDLAEALTHQTASANVLRVIASSPTDIRPVLNAIVESACELCQAYDGIVRLRVGDRLHAGAHYGRIPISEEEWPIDRNSVSGQAILERRPVHVRDMQSVEGERFPESKERALRLGHRTILSVPLVRDDTGVGVIILRRIDVEPFSDKQIAVLQTFADQAVIAIENARLFNETQQALERQTATADVLGVIASSPSNLQPVFDAIAQRSNELIGGHSTAVYRFVEGIVHLAAFTPVNPEADVILQNSFPKPVSELAPFALVHRGETVHQPDVLSPEALSMRTESGVRMIKRLAAARGFRSCLFVPLTSERGTIGMISVTRREVGLFAEHHIDLLKTFASQAVIAIANVNLFEQVQQRTRELSQSLDELRTAQDRLVQTEKLASLGQLTAGIAHEIKNPLNFVNNFSSLSVELIDEMTDALAESGLDQDRRAPLEELAQTLRSNLQKIEQHGKRADSIVKNMLLHSREGSGEQLSIDVNAIVDESLSLAYHGARAEKPGFNIALERNFDPSVGVAHVFPQEITRVLLNIISNGFYAASRRAVGAPNGFGPVLSAQTRNLGDNVEIRIRDNGIGMPDEVKARIFTPFFTTKPPGEGTGLGLSMSHDIIVKQHGGSIDVRSQPGEFTEFIIKLPRGIASKKPDGDAR
jgi:signal transduction histidine kinase/putative methionine-R-sulfoxide reductase with GAF domain